MNSNSDKSYCSWGGCMGIFLDDLGDVLEGFGGWLFGDGMG